MTNKANQRPIAKISDGRISVSLWKNDGEKKPHFAATFSRVYADAKGNLQNSTSFTGVELLKLARLSHLAYDEIKRLAADIGTEDEDRGE